MSLEDLKLLIAEGADSIEDLDTAIKVLKALHGAGVQIGKPNRDGYVPVSFK